MEATPDGLRRTAVLVVADADLWFAREGGTLGPFSVVTVTDRTVDLTDGAPDHLVRLSLR